MAWTSQTFVDSAILYASEVNAIQANFAALAAQDSGAPMIDVNCANVKIFESETITVSAFQTDTASLGTVNIWSANINILIVNSGITANSATFDSLLASDAQFGVGSFGTLHAGSANIDNIAITDLTLDTLVVGSSSIGTIEVNSNITSYIGNPFFACRAWVNIDTTSSDLTIKGSGNVTSVTDVAVGKARVNFNTSMQDSYYAAVVGANNSTGVQLNQDSSINVVNYLLESVEIWIINSSIFSEAKTMSVIVVR